MMAAKLEDFARHREDRRRATEPKNRARKAGRGCSICGAEPAGRYRPFCSARCADIDLHRWFSGVYAVPVEEDSDEDGLRDTPLHGAPPENS